jgi:hypothetical protein
VFGVILVVGLLFSPLVEVVSADGPAPEVVVTTEPVEADPLVSLDGGGTTNGFAWGD